MDRMAIEGNVLLNYGYAKGYKPLIDVLLQYMERKGVDLTGKDMLITSGFTEGLDIVLSSLGGQPGGAVICEIRRTIRRSKICGCTASGLRAFRWSRTGWT
ncbi:hypothetical protein HMSSN036_18560 [Paenibacillus macerans]|nr:hypothetical protein HMSSN036_18560 [Paenibacillus macerans]